MGRTLSESNFQTPPSVRLSFKSFLSIPYQGGVCHHDFMKVRVGQVQLAPCKWDAVRVSESPSSLYKENIEKFEAMKR